MTLFELRTAAYAGGTLHGLVADQDRRAIAVHLHGTWGNFYENSIATAFADVYARNGIDFATVNLPGHDSESVHEDFDASLSALDAWVQELARDRPLIWQGHSLGALKAVKHLATRASKNVEAVILLSPFDLPAFYAQSSDAASIEAKIAAVTEQVTAGQGEAPVSSDVFGVWPVSYRTMQRALERGGPWDVFPSAAGSVGNLGQLQQRTLVVLGGSDFAASPSPEEVANLLRSQAPELRSELIPGAPHNFAGYEKELAALVDGFLRAG